MIQLCVFKCETKNDIISKGTQIMTQLNEWFKANRLTLNSEKSNFLIFRLRKNKNNKHAETNPF